MKMNIHHLRDNVAYACRMLVILNLDSSPFGNISVRVPGTDTFYVNPNGITFEHVMPHDIVLMNTQGKKLSGELKPHPGEFIHRHIYRLRPDIEAIVHTHSPHTVALSLLGCAIEPYTQLGAAFHHDQGLYLGFTGPVRTTEEGADIAQALGDYSIVIAKNHGLFAANKNIAAALWDMVIAEHAAGIHLSAKQLGLEKADPMAAEFIQKSKIEVRDKQADFMWNSYMKKLQKNYPELFVNKEPIPPALQADKIF